MKIIGKMGDVIGVFSRSNRAGGSRGFSLVELLIAIGITGVVAAALYLMFETFLRQSQKLDLVLEAEQNARAGLNIMERELQNAGYQAATADVITVATATSMQFTYTDPSDVTVSATAGNRLRVMYNYDAVNTRLTRQTNNLTGGTTGSTERLMENVKNFSLRYYNASGTELADTSTQALRNSIIYVTITAVSETRDTVAGETTKRTFTLETHVRLRNLEIAQTVTDTTPPDSPTNVQVRDPKICGRLKVQWTLSTAGDTAGYKVYYGTSAGVYTGYVLVPTTRLTDGLTYSCTTIGDCTIFPSTLNYTKSDGSSTTTYFIAMTAYDKSLNESAFSTEVSGAAGTETIAGSNGDFAVALQDTTINPTKPTVITGFTGADGVADGSVNLSWTAYNTASYPDVTGMRIYRDTAPISSYPISPGLLVGTALPSTTSYTDAIAGFSGCQVYYYAVAPVNCDTTLITDDVGDDNTKRYVSSDYAVTYGDGAAGTFAGNIADSPGGADTAPPDSTGPSFVLNALGARAGWKRVAISLTQPADTNLSHTCIYAVQDSAAPSPTAAFDAQTPKCYTLNATPGGIRTYESTGDQTTTELARGASTAWWHNSMAALSAVPDLVDTATYSYTAVAIDGCGNASSTNASATTTLCGEDPASPATKPPAVTGLTAVGCTGDSTAGITLSWTGVTSDLSLPSSYSNPYDLAGYRIFRDVSSTFATGTLLNPTAPYWPTAYNNVDATGLTDGSAYYYRVYTTDCPYEKGDDTGGTPPTAAQMLSGAPALSYINAATALVSNAVYPGRIDRDEKTSAVKDAHREVLTGVDILGTGASTAAPSGAPTYNHSSVTMFFENTSGYTMTITGLSLRWVNAAAQLRQVVIGGGSSGVGVITTNVSASSTTSVSGAPPYTSEVSGVTLTSTVINALERHVPIKFVFKDSSGNDVDMGGDQLLITLNVTNDSTGTTTCVSYMTTSQLSAGVTVPPGPTIGSAVQNNPAAATVPYAVPGSTGLNSVPTDGTSYGPIVATGGAVVTITANITGETYDEVSGGKIPVSSATLYYKEAALTACDGTIISGQCSTAPSSGYTAAAMTSSGGNDWTYNIPAVGTPPRRVWYYIVTYDADGNFDRLPKVSEGAYTYDQTAFNRCDYTPNAPASLAYSSAFSPSDTEVTVMWPRVTTYTTGGAINTSADPVYYRVYRRSSLTGAFTKVYDVPDSSAVTGWISATNVSPATSSYYQCNPAWAPGYCVWWDYVNAVSNDLTYYVQTKNSCAANTNLSSATSYYRECRGATTAVLDVNPVSPTSINVGASYTVTVNDCPLSGGGIQTITVNNIADLGATNFALPLTEAAGDVGSFSGTVLTQRTSAATTTGVYTVPTNTANANVTVSCPGCSGPPATKTVLVKAAPCDLSPTALSCLNKSKTGTKVNLNWSACPNTDLDTPAYYDIYRSDNYAVVFASVAFGTNTWQSGNGGTAYSFKIKVRDSCPLSSGDSPIAAPPY